ncbi:MAG: glycosyltransferase family 39 protein [Microcoleaceae cyanobacterium]
MSKKIQTLKHTLTHQLRHINGIEHLSIFFVLLGILIRSVQYINNRSLWFDEASLALNIVQRSYQDLLKPLDYNQAAPPGFLWIEKLAIQLFDNHEYALRCFPFISGLISLVVFYKLATRYSSKQAAPVAIALFACLPYTIYYTTEVKQYSSDIMIALIFTLWLINWRNQQLNQGQIMALSLVGMIAIWLSHPAIFTLGGIELTYLLIAKNRRLIFRNRLPIYLSWLLSFGLLYYLTISPTLGNENLIESWSSRYPDSILDIVWLLDTLGRFFYRPLGFFSLADGVAMMTFGIGCWAFFHRDRITFLALTAPFLATLIASYLHQYPFRERLVLFLTPWAILMIAEGLIFLIQQPRQSVQGLGVLLLLILLIPPVVQSGGLILRPTLKEEFRPVLAYVKNHQRPGDRLYIYLKGRNHFAYYGNRYGYTEGDYILGQIELNDEGKISPEEQAQYQQDIQQFQGQDRVWLVFRAANSEESNLLNYPNQIGQPVDCFRQLDAFTCLYNFE